MAAHNLHEAKEKRVLRSGSCPVWIKMIVLGGQTGARVKEGRSNNDRLLIGLAWWSARLDGGTVLW